MLYVIAKDGRGDFTSVNEALAGMIWDGYAPNVLLLRDGDYSEDVRIDADRIRMKGESRDRTILCGSLTVTGKDVSVQEMTIRGQTDADGCRFCGCLRENNGEQNTLDTSDRFSVDPTPTWWICGDSTSANCTPEWAPQTNWTQIIPARLRNRAYVQSYAKSGASSKSFVQEGRLGAIELCICPGDRLFIQFSHNDEKAALELTTDARRTFPLWLDLYIDMARRHGAEPVLMTPFERRIVDEAGRLTFSHRDYPDAIRQKAKERGVRLVDMTEASRKLFLDTGLEESKKYFMWMPAGHPNYPDGAKDNTHFSREGAVALAQLFLEMYTD